MKKEDPGLKESAVQEQVSQILATQGCQLWRNNSGVARFQKNGREWFVRYGVGKGGSDLIGFKTVRITPEMVGKTVAVFCAVETKREKGGVKSDDQIAFVDNVKAFGGIGGFSRTWQEAMQIIKDYMESLKRA